MEFVTERAVLPLKSGMIRIRNTVFIFLLIAYGCTVSDNVDEQDAPEELETVVVAPPRYIDLSSGGLPLHLVEISGDSTEVTASWNATFGRMEVELNPDISLFIKEDTISIATKVFEIESGVFEIDYLVKTDSLIFYKTSLPGGISPYWHFFASFPIDGVYYNFENNPVIECDQRQIETMLGIVSRIAQNAND